MHTRCTRAFFIKGFTHTSIPRHADITVYYHLFHCLYPCPYAYPHAGHRAQQLGHSAIPRLPTCTAPTCIPLCATPSHAAAQAATHPTAQAHAVMSHHAHTHPRTSTHTHEVCCGQQHCRHARVASTLDTFEQRPVVSYSSARGGPRIAARLRLLPLSVHALPQASPPPVGFRDCHSHSGRLDTG